jgi:hypothetical protein
VFFVALSFSKRGQSGRDRILSFSKRGQSGRDHMVVGFTTHYQRLSPLKL